jgi:hypothetical protein
MRSKAQQAATSPRALAQAAGEKHYFTGEPCSKGHVALRRVSNGSCVVCAREDCRERHSRFTKERKRERNAKYLERNGEAIRERRRARPAKTLNHPVGRSLRSRV